MKKGSNYMKKLLTNGSGTSVKSFLAFIVTIVGILLLISITAVIWIDVLYNKELKTTLEYYPDIIAGVSALIFSGAVPKIVGEITEKKIKNEY